MFGTSEHALLLLALSMASSTAVAHESVQAASVTIANTRSELDGRWQGKLEYRDYRANRWFGIPTMVTIELIGDGATVIRKEAFDDGDSGTVYITVISLLAPDGKTEYVGSFRADRPAELSNFTLRFADPKSGDVRDATHWTVVAESAGEDDNRPATIRETTTRNGSKMVSLKEVDYSDDDKAEWLQRNRITLEQVGE